MKNEKPKHKNILIGGICLFLCGFLIVSCTSISQEVPPTPTIDFSQPLDLGNFSAALKSKGVHGGMVCITYEGNPTDLLGVSLKAFITRQDKYIEFGIPLEEVDGEMCFEITDSKYLSVSDNVEGGRLIIPDDLLTLRITAESEVAREIYNNNQEIALGKYEQFPFMGWIYPEGVQAGCVADSHYRIDPFTNREVFYPAWDMIPEPTDEYPTIVGTPVLAPVDGIYYVYNIPSEDEESPFGFNAIMIYSPDTGYLVNLTHEFDLMEKDGKWIMLEELTGKAVKAGEQIGIIGPKDWGSGIPHTHVQVTVSWVDILRTNSPETIYGYLTNINHPNIDFLKEELFLDEDLNSALSNPTNTLSTCQNYPWGEVVIPQELEISIDGQDQDWAGYQPVLTDTAGDSIAGEVMDFTEVFVAEDTNYLYLMLRAGTKPGESWEPWTIAFSADLSVENLCEGTEWEFHIHSENANGILIDRMVGCDGNPDMKAYPAEYAWGDVLEIRILKAYLRNPPEIDILQVKSYLIESDESYILSDEMK